MKLRGDRCQCTVCDEYFNSTYAFDKHRKGNYQDRRCEYPSGLGMVKNEAGFWISGINPRVSGKTPEIN